MRTLRIPPPTRTAHALCAVILAACAWPACASTAAQPAPQIAVARDGNQITLTWDSLPGWRYHVYHSTGLEHPWEELTSNPLVSSVASLSHQAPISPGVRLFRIAKQAPETAVNMVWIPRGTFTMGGSIDDPDANSDEQPQREVTLTRGFWMAQYTVTQAEYQEVMGTNPSFFNGVRNWPAPNTDYGFEPNRPVESVSWEDALAYCAALTERERAAGRIEADMSYRLPTEAEWEYAARAGTTTRFSYGDDPDYSELGNYAWYSANSNNRTHPVGQKLPNPWGLYDMYGNVWQWCLDYYGPYTSDPVTDPQGPETGSLRVIRGGTFAQIPSWCRSSNRDTPRGPTYDFGFRVVLSTNGP
jgi:formylglycine-generating enzyme required for sulfatase activity